MVLNLGLAVFGLGSLFRVGEHTFLEIKMARRQILHLWFDSEDFCYELILGTDWVKTLTGALEVQL